MLKVGVAGLKRGMGLLKVFALQEGVKVVAACDIDEKQVENAGRQTDLEASYSDYNDFLGHDMDMVVVVRAQEGLLRPEVCVLPGEPLCNLSQLLQVEVPVRILLRHGKLRRQVQELLYASV